MSRPAFQDVSAASLPTVGLGAGGVEGKVLVGTVGGKSSPVRTTIPVQYVDFEADAGRDLTHQVGDVLVSRIMFVYRGEARVGDQVRGPRSGGR